MFATGGKARQSQVVIKSTINSSKSTRKNCQPPNQSRTVSASLTKTTTTTLRTSRTSAVESKIKAPDKTIQRYVNRTKLKEIKSAPQRLPIPFADNQDIPTTQLARDSSSGDTIASNQSTISKQDSRTDIDAEDRSKPSEAHVAMIGATIKPKTLVAKTSKQVKTFSATTKSLVRQNPYIVNAKIPEKVEIPLTSSEIAIQTNEGEILDHSLVVGDLKIMPPSKSVIEDIEKLRQQIKTKKLLKTSRTFEEHSVKEEEHLNDLNEFLEKSYVTRKQRTVPGNAFEKDRKLIAAMDQLLSREITRTESIADIKARIKLKEQELFSLFDNVPTTNNN